MHLDRAKEAVKAAGGELKAFSLTMGRYETITSSAKPNDAVTSEQEGQTMNRPPEQGDVDRRTALLLGLAGASTLVLGTGDRVLAQDEPGIERKVIKEGESVIPGFAKVRLREVIFQPGGRAKATMKNPMVCECSQGSFESTVDGKLATRKQGDIWTCKEGQVIENVNKGNTVAVMRVFDLLPA